MSEQMPNLGFYHQALYSREELLRQLQAIVDQTPEPLEQSSPRSGVAGHIGNTVLHHGLPGAFLEVWDGLDRTAAAVVQTGQAIVSPEQPPPEQLAA